MNKIYTRREVSSNTPLLEYYYASEPGKYYYENNPNYVASKAGLSDFLFGKGFSSVATNASNAAANNDSHGFGQYLSGLFSSVGDENAKNREYNSAEAQLQREFSSIEAEKNRQWQEMMSNSAYTRAVADLRKAGLNPLLAVGGMSTTPSGAVASGSSASYQTGGGDTMSDVLQALASSASALSDILGFFIPKIGKKS